MIDALRALAIVALTAAVPAGAAQSVDVSESPSPSVSTEQAREAERSDAVARVADWIIASHDNGSLPYIIIDKRTAGLFLFDAQGKPLGEAPILIGVAIGDEATPGVGTKPLAEIGPAERTTPAGRFLARYGRAATRQRVLWVDYTTSVALHPVIKGTKTEQRRARLLSPTSEDNRITFGCINVPLVFYSKKIRPLFAKNGGVVYVLPDTKLLEDVFPRLRVQPFTNTEPS